MQWNREPFSKDPKRCNWWIIRIMSLHIYRHAIRKAQLSYQHLDCNIHFLTQQLPNTPRCNEHGAYQFWKQEETGDPGENLREWNVLLFNFMTKIWLQSIQNASLSLNQCLIMLMERVGSPQGTVLLVLYSLLFLFNYNMRCRGL